MSEQEHEQAKTSRKVPIIILIAVIIVLIGGFLGWLYTGSFTNAKSNVFAKLPLPVALVNNRIVTGPELVSRLQIAEALLAQQNIKVEEVRGDVYSQLIDSKKFHSLAGDKNIYVSGTELEDELNAITRINYEGDRAKMQADLRDQFGLSEGEFRQTVLRDNIVQYKLEAWHNGQESLNSEAYEKARKANEEIKNKPFEEIVAAYSQDAASKVFAGDMGFQNLEDILPEWKEALKDANAGDIKQVPSRYGLHLIKVVEKDKDAESGAERIHFQQIFIQTNDFDSWFETQTQNMKVVKLLSI